MSQDKNLLNNARSMRTTPTPFEAKLWAHLARSQRGGHKFRRQHVIENMICDFFCPAKRLIIEIDGDTHDRERDVERDAVMMAKGYTTLRFTNREVGENIEGVLKAIEERLSQLSHEWLDFPTPTPPLKGRG